jgi:hypothetical protein
LPFNMLTDRADQLRKGRATSLHTVSRVPTRLRAPVNISQGKVSARPHFEGRPVDKHQRAERHRGEKSVTNLCNADIVARAQVDGEGRHKCIHLCRSHAIVIHKHLALARRRIKRCNLSTDPTSSLRYDLNPAAARREVPRSAPSTSVSCATVFGAENVQKSWDSLAANNALGVCSKRVPCISPVCSLATTTSPLRRLCTLPLCSLVGWCHHSTSNRGL